MVKKLLYDFVFCITNYFVAYIPIWQIRKLFYVILGMKIDSGSRINMRTIIFSPWKICIGCNTVINEKCLLDGRGGVVIGDNCSVSYNSCIYSASHLTDSEIFEGYTKKTIISDGVWICVNAVVLPGAYVDELCVISANSVFSGKSQKKGIYRGNLAKLEKYRKLDTINVKSTFFFR